MNIDFIKAELHFTLKEKNLLVCFDFKYLFYVLDLFHVLFILCIGMKSRIIMTISI